MGEPAKIEAPVDVTPPRAGIPDEELSPEELEDLEAFRAMAKISRRATRLWLDQLIRPVD